MRIVEHFKEDRFVYLVLAFCEDGTLKSNIDQKKLTEGEAKSIAKQLALGISFLHQDLEISHNNIRPDNILCNNRVYKIS